MTQTPDHSTIDYFGPLNIPAKITAVTYPLQQEEVKKSWEENNFIFSIIDTPFNVIETIKV